MRFPPDNGLPLDRCSVIAALQTRSDMLAADFDSTIRRFESSRPSQKLQDRVLSLCGCQTAFVENPRSACAAAVSYIVKSHDVSNSRDWLSPIESFAAARLGLSALGDIVLRKPGNVEKPRTYEISISAPPVRRAVRYRAS